MNEDPQLSLEEADFFSAGEGGETSASDGTPHTAHKFRSDMRELNRYPPLRISIALLYLAAVILKLPILLNDLYL